MLPWQIQWIFLNPLTCLSLQKQISSFFDTLSLNFKHQSPNTCSWPSLPGPLVSLDLGLAQSLFSSCITHTCPAESQNGILAFLLSFFPFYSWTDNFLYISSYLPINVKNCHFLGLVTFRQNLTATSDDPSQHASSHSKNFLLEALVKDIKTAVFSCWNFQTHSPSPFSLRILLTIRYQRLFML